MSRVDQHGDLRPTSGFSPGRLLGLGFVVVGVAILIGLGVWQLERKVENARMLAGIAALQGAPPRPLDAVLKGAAGAHSLDFIRVSTPCPALFAGPSVHLYSLTDAGPGWRTIVACPLSDAPYGSILVDRGFTPQDPGKTAPAAAPSAAGLANTAPVIGVLRRAPPPNFADPKHRMGEGDWYGRDLPGMAAALHAANPAPVFLILESPSAGPGGPTPTPLPVEVRDNLQYALTWFGLAAALIGVYIATQVARRRKA
jgi:surfeit locus 1 family protein